jgi:hypothetical protein
MAITTGLVSSIKVSSFIQDSPNAFDICYIGIKENANTAPLYFYLWNARSDAPAVQRVTQSQRLALLREAAFRGLTVMVTYDEPSSLISSLQVNLP